MKRRAGAPKRRVRPWKHIYKTDRGYTARVDRAITRGQHTPPDAVGSAK